MNYKNYITIELNKSGGSLVLVDCELQFMQCLSEMTEAEIFDDFPNSPRSRYSNESNDRSSRLGLCKRQ